MVRAARDALTTHVGPIGLFLLWIAAGTAVLTGPRATGSAPSADPRALHRVVEAVAHGSGIAVASAPNGDVWWVTAGEAVRFEAGDPTRPHPTAHPWVGESGRTLDPIAAVHVDRRGDLWLGTRHGRVWLRRDGAWREVPGRFDAQRLPIAAIATRGDTVYVAGRGLWRGALGEPLEELPLFAGVPIAHAVAHPEHGVAVVAGEDVWREDDSDWRRVWQLQPGDGAVTAFALAPEGELWIGTRGGLIRIDAEGRERRELSGTPIDALAAGPGSAFAGTRGSGLFARYAGGWRRVDAAGGLDVLRVTGLAAARHGALWLTMDGGLYRAAPAGRAPAAVSAL